MIFDWITMLCASRTCWRNWVKSLSAWTIRCVGWVRVVAHVIIMMFFIQARFILMVVEGKLQVAKRKKADLVQELVSLGFKGFKGAKATSGSPASDGSSSDTEEPSTPTMSAELEKSYNYLLNMPLWSLTKEKVDELLKEKDQKASEVEALKRMTPSDMWLKDLDELDAALDEVSSMLKLLKGVSFHHTSGCTVRARV